MDNSELETPGNWEIIEVGFEGADETINFGTRIISEEQLYETRTLATITSDTTTSNEPKIHSILNNDKLYLSIDNTFRVLSSQCSQLEVMLNLSSVIQTFAVLQNRYVGIVLENGELQCFDLENEGDLLFTTTTEDECAAIFTADNGFTFVTKTGKIQRIIVNFDGCLMEDITDLDRNLLNGCLLNNNEIAVLGTNTFTTVQNNNTCLTSTFGTVKKTYSTSNGFIITLNENGHLVAVCSETLLHFIIYDEICITDFVFIDDLNLNESHLLALTAPDEIGHGYIQCITYPGFETIYRLKLQSKTYLTESSYGEETLYIEGVTQNDIVKQLRIKIVSPTDPTARLQRLLKRGRFDEAEKFAQQWKLNPEPVWQARARAIADERICIDPEELFEVLDRIKDVKFIVECVIDTTVGNGIAARKLYGYCRRRLRTNMAANPQDRRIWKLLTRVETLSRRLDTFSLLSMDPNNFIDEWERFCGCDLVGFSEALAQRGRLNESGIVLTHAEEDTVKSSLNTFEKLQLFLNASPENIETDLLIPWFRVVFNRVATVIPGSLTAFINWLTNRLERLEKLHPKRALALAEGVLDTMRVVGGANTAMLRRQCASNAKSLERVQSIVFGLKRIEELRERHQITISLNEYLQGGISLIHKLLALVNVDGLKRLHEDFLLEYMRRNLLQPDSVLEAFIEEVTENEGGWWEALAAEVVRCISNREIRLKTTIKIIRCCDVPWTETINRLTSEILEACGTHSLCDEIRQLRSDVPFKMLLTKYVRKRIDTTVQFTESQVIRFGRKLLQSCHGDPINDIEVLIKKFPSLSSQLKVQLILNLVKTNINEARKQIESFTIPEIILCWSTFINRIVETNETILYELIGVLYDRILKSLPKIFQKYSLYTEQYNEILRHREFGLVEFDLKQVVERAIGTETNWNVIITKLKRASFLYNVRECDLLLELARRTAGNVTVVLAICENASDDLSSNEFIKLAALVISSVCEEEENVSNISNGDLSETLNATLAKFDALMTKNLDDTICKCLKMADDLFGKAILQIDSKNEFCSFPYVWATLTKLLIGLTPWTYSNVFVPERNDLSVVNVFKEAFLSCTSMCGKVSLPEWMVSDFEPEKQLGVILENIKGLQPDLITLQLIQTIVNVLESLESSTKMKYVEKFENVWNTGIAPPVLHKLIRASHSTPSYSSVSDWTLFLYILKHMGRLNAHTWIKRALFQYRMEVHNFSTVATLGLYYVQSINTSDDTHIGYKDIQLRCKWWLKCFNTIDACPNYIEHFKLAPDHLLRVLLDGDVATLLLLTEFCTDFGIDLRPYLPVHLKNILLNYTPVECESPTEAVIALTKKCREIVHKVDNEIVVDLLQSIWNDVSYYRYEVFLCILDLISDLKHEPPNELLLFLCGYKRIQRPQQREPEEWQKRFPQKPELDPLASTRLPYLPTELNSSEVWRLLRPEVTLETYRTWFDAAHILSLNKNDICTYAIKDALSSGLLSRNTKAWQLEPQQPDLIKRIAECASHMTNLEMATAVLYQATWSCSGGADQCALAKHCWETCSKWIENDNPPTDAVTRVQRKFLSCHTEHILHQNHLANEKYLKLVTQPQQLISSLYQDERIVLKNGCAFDHQCPDINSAVDQIAVVHTIEVKEIRRDFVERLLQANSSIEVEEEQALVRICYIAESGPLNEWTDFLSEQCYETETEENDTPASLSVRVLSLRCISALLTDDFDPKQKELLHNLRLFERLERIGIALTETEFDSIEKPDLVRRLLAKPSPIASLLMIELMIHYNIHDPLLWESVLKRSIQSLPVDSIKECLIWLSQLEHVASGSTYMAAWAGIIDSTMAVATAEDSDEKWANSLVLLQSCPHPSRLNIGKMYETCTRNHRIESGVCLLPYVTDVELRAKIINDSLVIDLIQLRSRLAKLERFGVLSAELAFNIVSSYRSNSTDIS